MKHLLLAALMIAASPASAADVYEIDAAVNDEKFVIDDEMYEAKTWCLYWDEGDQVVFVDGTPGLCVSATLFNLNRSESCNVWCE